MFYCSQADMFHYYYRMIKTQIVHNFCVKCSLRARSRYNTLSAFIRGIEFYGSRLLA